MCCELILMQGRFRERRPWALALIIELSSHNPRSWEVFGRRQNDRDSSHLPGQKRNKFPALSSTIVEALEGALWCCGKQPYEARLSLGTRWIVLPQTVWCTKNWAAAHEACSLHSPGILCSEQAISIEWNKRAGYGESCYRTQTVRRSVTELEAPVTERWWS